MQNQSQKRFNSCPRTLQPDVMHMHQNCNHDQVMWLAITWTCHFNTVSDEPQRSQWIVLYDWDTIRHSMLYTTCRVRLYSTTDFPECCSVQLYYYLVSGQDFSLLPFHKVELKGESVGSPDRDNSDFFWLVKHLFCQQNAPQVQPTMHNLASAMKGVASQLCC